MQFGARAGTLVVQAGAVFGGGIIANANVADELVLAGSSSVALDGFGREILNISEISFATASWGIEGNVDGLAAVRRSPALRPETPSSWTVFRPPEKAM